MPYYLPQALAVWLVAILVIQWHRWRELLVYGLMGGYLALFEDHLGGMFGLWLYGDVGPLSTHHQISLLISVSAAPLFAMFFAQGLKPRAPFPWLRILAITSVAMVPEIVGMYTGNITHGRWWNNWWSFVAHFLVWLGIWLVHRAMTSNQGSKAG